MPGALDHIGNTPLVELEGFDRGPCRLFLKLETQNPAGSIKDRMARSMVEAAERDGVLRPGGVIVEATAGNTGLGLALVAAAKGYRLILVLPDKMSSEKIAHLRAFGADVRLTRSDVKKGHPDFYQDLAQRIAAETPCAFYVNQFTNPANPLAHEATTGPEIWRQMDHNVDAIVCGVGSGGTITGLSRYFARVQPACDLVLADPQGSGLAGWVNDGKPGPSGSYMVEGIGGDTPPPVCDLARVRRAYSIPDAESFATARQLLRSHGWFGGSSSGTLIAAALRYCRDQKRPKRVVTFLCDSGNKYLSKLFNDYWMLDQGLLDRPRTGDLRDWITRRYEEGAVITVSPNDTLLTAFQRMRLADVSQVPVLDNGAVAGILDESDVLVRVHGDPARFRDPVRTAMTSKVETLPPSAPLDSVIAILDAGKVALVMDDGHFLGLITRTDLLSHLRRQLR
ncbi:MAG: cystathionine beta-synthase [Bryobacterales bacterium]|nr:cystathionine beta-synthase [Bryobacterales bacterium]